MFSSKKKSAFLLPAFLAGCLIVAGLSFGLKRRAVMLPNGYYLKPAGEVVAVLKDEKGGIVTKFPVNQFRVEGEYVYGILDGNGYFMLNTQNGKLIAFGKWKDLEKYAEEKNIKNISRKLITYWDIAYRYKKPTW